MATRHAALAVSVAMLGLATLGCNEGEALGPPAGPQSVNGSYRATTFTIQTTQLHDVLALGGSLLLNLHAGGTTTGQIFIPASVAGGTDFSANLAGTYSVAGTTVQFDQAAATFVRDMDFMIVGTTLRGTGTTVSGVVITVVLTRS